MKKILLIGPIPEPTTGVSLANKVVIENLLNDKDFKISTINTSYNKFEENLGTFSISKALFFIKLNFSAYKIFNADIVYLTPGQTFFGVLKYAVFILISRLSKKEIIIHVHGNHLGTEYKLLKGLKKRVFRSLLNRTDKGIVLSESLKDNLLPFLKDKKIFVLFNFVEDYLFASNNLIVSKQPVNFPQIIFLSNLMEEKGVFDLLEGLKILEQSGFDFKAKIAGNIDANNKARIEAYFKNSKNVTYIGVVSGEEKKTLLEWGNIFALPTYYKMEGQPISILEAMATGNIILTTNHAGISDIFKDEVNGFYVEKKNSKDIAKKIKRIALDVAFSKKIMTENIITAKEKYRVAHFITNIKAILKATNDSPYTKS